MIELRAADLCFTTEETSFYFNKIMNLKLSSENITILKSRTEGWAAGLQMAALSMKNRKDISGFIKTFAGDNRHIMDYLLDEVLNRQSDFIRSFLLKTSILDRLSGSLCNAITGQENCQKTLKDLEVANLFVIPLDNKRQWYRYHHLFADLLHIYLNQSLPDLIPELHRRASKWHEQNNLIDEAINHSLAAKDFEQAALLTEKTFIDRMSRGEDFSTMLRRLEALPDNIVRSSATLNIMYAYMLSITLQLDKVEPRLNQVEIKFENQLTADLRRQIALIRADLARHKNDFIKAIQLSQKILKELPKNPSFSDMQTMTGCVFNLAWAFFLKGDTANAQHYFSEALKISRAANSITLSLLSLSGLGRTQIWQGQLHRAFDTLQQGVQLAEEAAEPNGQSVPASVYIYLALGELFCEWNRLEEANYHLNKMLELSWQYQIDGETLREGYLVQSRVKRAIGDIPAALEIIKQAEQLAQEYPSVRGFNIPSKICWARLMIGQIVSTDVGDSKLEEVRKWIESRNLESEAKIGSIVEESEFLIWIRLLITKNETRQALKLLARLYQAAKNNGRGRSIIEILVLQALAFKTSGEIQKAITSIQKALEIAEPEGFIRIFLDEGQLLAELLEEIISSGKLNINEPKNKILHRYIKKLLLEFKLGLLPKTQSGLVDPLSERELEVLRLIETGLTNLKIGEQLFISLNTVRTHTKNINSKLNVNSRTQAIVRAKELGII